MIAAIKRHYWRNEDFYRGARIAALMITELIIPLALELQLK